jgi:hypothetical protein
LMRERMHDAVPAISLAGGLHVDALAQLP